MCGVEGDGNRREAEASEVKGDGGGEWKEEGQWRTWKYHTFLNRLKQTTQWTEGDVRTYCTLHGNGNFKHSQESRNSITDKCCVLHVNRTINAMHITSFVIHLLLHTYTATARTHHIHTIFDWTKRKHNKTREMRRQPNTFQFPFIWFGKMSK